ncbi:MAG: RNA polymerase sigma-54 factor, partial [Hyphomicrobiaceae bacterium]|nr:RNA polymerase sigma-54 factor [Hyphomicrobiaceae bacterium]
MALSTKLELRQGQQLVMTPQLQQAIRLLQLSNLELSSFVDEELERNPLLERNDRDAEPNVRTIDTPDIDENPLGPDWAGESTALDLSQPTADPVAALDTDIETICPDAARTEIVNEGGGDRDGPMLGGQFSEARSNASSFSDDDANLEAYLASGLTLADHLGGQLALAAKSHRELMIGRRIIDHIDDAGYLAAEV